MESTFSMKLYTLITLYFISSLLKPSWHRDTGRVGLRKGPYMKGLVGMETKGIRGEEGTEKAETSQ